MDLNLFNNKEIGNNKNNYFINTFIEELKNALKNIMNEGIGMNQKKNISSVCLSEHGDGGPYSITDIDLPKDAKVGEVYEKIDGEYVYNEAITEELNKIEK